MIRRQLILNQNFKKMKTNVFKTTIKTCALALGLMITLAGCKKSADTTPANPYGGNKGQTTFWSSHSGPVYPITVTVGGVTIGSIGGALSSAPDCQGATDKVVKFDNAPGTYNFTCMAANNAGNWTGAITITEGGCYAAELK
jgi:hypothetical protein